MIKGGIWCNNSVDGNTKLEDIIYQYDRIGIFPCRVLKRKEGNSVVFENGDFWQVIKANELSRGYKLNISYIQYGIPREIIDRVILPATICHPFQAFNYWGKND
jgi:hypothetical protein